ncbi:MAG TPA: TldD/PmbA family protein [Woeseiaceae bacterium]|nr:TldD/PmbA family protein [Woeseiaceae bacterium]
MRPDLDARAADAVQLALAAGADETFAFATQSRDVEFSYRDGALEKVKDAVARNLSIELYVDGRYSSHQTTDLNPDRLREFVEEAVALTRALEPDPYRQITPAELFENRKSVDLDLVDAAVAALDRNRRLAWCAALDAATRTHERVISATAGVYDGTVTSAAASSNGFSGSQESTYCWLGSNVTLKDRGDRRASDGFYAGDTHVDDLPPTQSIGETALERALVRLDAEKGPTVKTTMVVDSRAAASLIGRLIRPANAAGVQQGRSFWADLIGRKAFSDKLSITDDPLIVRGLASRLYDAEGIAAKALPVVAEGRVENLYVDTYYGRKAEMQPTTGSPSNVRIATGTHSLDELLSDAGEGVYVTSWLGGNADGTTGDFSLGLRGHMIENGKIGRPVGEMNVTGNLRRLFLRLEAVGSDPYPYATILAPSMMFSGVDFSGA